MNRRTNLPDYPPERMVLLSYVNHTQRRRFAPPAMFCNQGNNFSIDVNMRIQVISGRDIFQSIDCLRRIFYSLYFFKTIILEKALLFFFSCL